MLKKNEGITSPGALNKAPRVNTRWDKDGDRSHNGKTSQEMLLEWLEQTDSKGEYINYQKFRGGNKEGARKDKSSTKIGVCNVIMMKLAENGIERSSGCIQTKVSLPFMLFL